MLAPRERRHALLACLLVAASSGFIYDFSVYSGALKAQFKLKQASVDWVATAGVFFFWTSPLGGYMVDKHGPRLTNIIGGLTMTTGLVLSYLFAMGYVPRLPRDPASATFILSVCSCITTIGANAAAAVAFTLPVKFYPNSRGYVTGLVKSSAGLAGGLLAQLFTLLVGPPGDTTSTLGFLLFLACTTFSINVLLSPLLLPTGAKMRTHPMNAQSKRPRAAADKIIRRRVKASCLIVICLICAVMLSSFLTAVETVSPPSANSSAGPRAIVPTKSVGAYLLAAVLCMLMFGTGVPLLFEDAQSFVAEIR